MAENKVKFGLKNVHYSTFEVLEGVTTYGVPVRIPGAVELELDPRGDMMEFYADDMVYYATSNNQGYEGTLSVALIPESFSTNVLGEVKNEDGVITESTNDKGSNFALMFEFDGDKKAVRHVLYNCTSNRPTVGSETKNDSTEPIVDELTFVATGREDDQAVKSKTSGETDVLKYESWYEEVYEETVGL